MSVLIIGSEGSMGKRYQAIFKFLGIKFDTYDMEMNFDKKTIDKKIVHNNKILITSPTETHFEWVSHITKLVKNKRILCEKPLSKDIGETEKMLESNLKMVLQYKYMPFDKYEYELGGGSKYDYFRSGKDGLAWDCLQIIGLSEDMAFLSNKSPIWNCKINGKKLNFSHMDFAYIEMLRSFLVSEDDQEKQDILNMHKKVIEGKYILL